MGARSDQPGWKAFFDAARQASTGDQRDAAALPIAAVCDAVLEEHRSASPTAEKFWNGLALATLNTSVGNLSTTDAASLRVVVTIGGVLVRASPRLAVVLAEQGFLTSLAKLHTRTGDLNAPLAQAVVLLVTQLTLLFQQGANGSLEGLAGREELRDMLLSHLLYLAVRPEELHTPRGLGTAARCTQLLWELTRDPTPKSKALREFLKQVGVASRLLALAAAAMSPPPPAAAAEEEAVAGLAALDGGSAAGASPAGSAAVGPGEDMWAERLALASQACSLACNLAGLGDRGSTMLSREALAPQRAWLLRSGHLKELRGALDGLAEGLAEQRRRAAAAEEAGLAAAAGAEAQSAQGDALEELRPAKLPLKRLVLHAEGAVRNVLYLLGLPTVVMGSGEDDVVDGCGFVIRLFFELYTEGYLESFKSLKAAVAEQAPSPAAPAPLPPYAGDYGPFFRAYAGHMEEVVPALGVQLEDWGVRFTGEQRDRDLPGMEVGEGVDARIADAWIKGQIQNVINWGNQMIHLIRMAEQAKLPVQQQQQPARQQGQGQPAFPSVAAPRPVAGSGRQGGGAVAVTAGGEAAGEGRCVGCGKEQEEGGPPLKGCSQCKAVKYCSKACQVGDWKRHKPECQASVASAAAGKA